jgi:hypothetical protein
MGDRYDLTLKCKYCGRLNDVWYAPTCNSDTFECKDCGSINFINSDLKSQKMEEVTYESIEDGFLNATSVSWSDEDVKRICSQRLKELKEAKPKVKSSL